MVIMTDKGAYSIHLNSCVQPKKTAKINLHFVIKNTKRSCHSAAICRRQVQHDICSCTIVMNLEFRSPTWMFNCF